MDLVGWLNENVQKKRVHSRESVHLLCTNCSIVFVSCVVFQDWTSCPFFPNFFYTRKDKETWPVFVSCLLFTHYKTCTQLEFITL